jgi:hypothetical protein
MKPAAPAPRARPSGKSLCALACVFAAGVVAATTTTSSAAPLDGCVLPPPLTCPTVSTPTLPTVSVPLPTTTAAPPPTTTATTTPAGTQPPPSPTGPAPAQAEAGPAATPFSFSIGRISARRIGLLRRLELQLSLSHPALVVAVLHRRDVPSLVAIRAGRAGANRFTVAVPARVRAGRHTLKLVFGTGAEQHTVLRSISVPR